MQVKFKEWTCNLEFAKYSHDNSTAIQLVDAEDGSPIATATVCIPGTELAEDEVLIKDWSENQGMLDCLITAGVVKPTGEEVPTGYVAAHLCKLLVKPE